MAYSELIKNFEKIRSYMREFYVYGFKTRDEYDGKSARSYDNERRRIESWLGEFMEFKIDNSGKTVFLSVDSRSIKHNPLYKAFKAKSFTDKDITLHFYILDILQSGIELSTPEIIEIIHNDYLDSFDTQFDLDDSTVRKKLKEYEQLGILKSRKAGRELLYSRIDDGINLLSWQYAVSFFSEEAPLGVVGSYILDKYKQDSGAFNYKHHYMLHTLDSQVLLSVLQGIDEHRAIEVTMFSHKKGKETKHTLCPVRIMVSTQTGRQYLFGYHYRFRRPFLVRLDNILSIALGNEEKQYDKYLNAINLVKDNLWGASLGQDISLDHIEMTIHVERNEYYIVDRLEREKRCGRVEKIDNNTYKYVADVYDAGEMLIWLRTFIGRIENLECTNKYVTDCFYDDLKQMYDMYGGDTNVQ